MGRPREFDRDEALDKAIRVFWTRGYDAPTMSDLRQAMGIGRQSLYDTFGDKKQLFGEAFDRYLGMSDAHISGVLEAHPGVEGVRQYLLGTASSLTDDPDRAGCLIFNSCSQSAPHDAEIEARALRGVKNIRRRLEAALRRAARDEEISADLDPKALALSLTATLAGMVVLSRGGATKRELRSVANLALTPLD